MKEIALNTELEDIDLPDNLNDEREFIKNLTN